ncbi:MAG TPA: O-antigen ligase family protein [Candidatus Woesebacteria bacterium]|nr:O-antigen ligase family protein [Candidatus Woesebacteria bacterium]
MSKRPETSPIYTQIIRWLFYLLFFVTPLILWPYTSEVFEFNKMLFVYLMTILIGATWLTKSFVNHRFEFVRTKLDLPILLFLVSQIISTIISINPHTSLWGYYSRFHGGLMSTVSYVLLYYAFVTHFHGEKKALGRVLIAILSSAAVISFYGVLEHFGIDKNIWVQDVQNRVFSTLGQPNWLSAFLVALLPLSLYQAVNANTVDKKYLHLGLSLLFLITIVFTKSQSGLGATAVILLLFFIITSVQKGKSWLILGLIPITILLFIFAGSKINQTLNSLNKINPFYSDTLTIITEENKTRVGGSDSMAIRRVVWEGAIKLGLSHPLFGTGVETFGYSYYQVRPASHNLTSETDFLYNKAHNEYLNFFANSGFVGLGTYLFLTGSILYLFLNKKTKHGDLRLPLLLGFISILITNYFGFSVVNIGLFFFLFPAIYLSSLDAGEDKSIELRFDTILGVSIVVIGAIWLLINLNKSWRGDIAYNLGRNSYEESKKALELNPHEPIYYAQYGYLNALIAVQIIAPQIEKQIPATASAELKQKAESYINSFISEAISNSERAVSMNPHNLNILKTKAKTELTLAELYPQYNQEAVKTLTKITEISPTDSSNYFNLGVLYLSLGQNNEAKTAFQTALDLKPDYQSATNYLEQLSQPVLK